MPHIDERSFTTKYSFQYFNETKIMKFIPHHLIWHV